MRSSLFMFLVVPFLLNAQEQKPPKPLPRPAPEKPAPPKPFGNLRVHVEDTKGAPVVGAQVGIEKLSRTHETEATGDVLMAWIPVGTHEIKISKAGFKKASTTAKIVEEMNTVVTVLLEAESK